MFGKLDLSKPKRHYYNDKIESDICPECGSKLVKESCAILLFARSSTDKA